MLTAFAEGALFGTNVAIAPAKPTVLALHGWGGNYKHMAGSIEGFDAIAVDLPGFGRSPAPDEVWGAAEYAASISQLFEQMNTPVVVVGYSFGGRVAIRLAVDYPDKVKALVLTGVPLLRATPSKKPPLGFKLMKLANKARIVSEARMEAERQKRGSTDYRNATGVMRSILVKSVNETYEEELAQVRCPVEMVWGEHDTAATVEIAQRARALLNVDSRLTVVPNRTHQLPLEDPAPIRAAMQRVLV